MSILSKNGGERSQKKSSFCIYRTGLILLIKQRDRHHRSQRFLSSSIHQHLYLIVYTFSCQRSCSWFDQCKLVTNELIINEHRQLLFAIMCAVIRSCLFLCPCRFIPQCLPDDRWRHNYHRMFVHAVDRDEWQQAQFFVLTNSSFMCARDWDDPSQTWWPNTSNESSQKIINSKMKCQNSSRQS